ncbi:hypothetical protein GJV26_10825 [Massilia dura]|uniref:Uncharacterized protein n=1 Tax=Pseudoduganella dura TaxID=321982 RepID=A0A6I3XK06_9BURK|nr:hypothetical protein [Pseudoduganella dura]MUI12948.1 hypothetical protein [Pseudoduganella dura]GGX88351.1 hypothetical protein GCM10007386_19090 [Pseudoduganella dura]
MTIISRTDTAQRNAWNAAFHELDLPWFWDVGCDLPDPGAERGCVRDYLTRHHGHLLTAYDADFLVDAILAAKERCEAECLAAGGDPGMAIDWRALRQPQIGI